MTDPDTRTDRTGMPELRTERLLLRDWREEDLDPFAELNADPVAMEHFPSALSAAQSAQMVERIRERWFDDGLSWWAVESRDTGEFLGAVGLMRVDFDAPFNDPARPSIEAGWRLRRAAWGHGYAPEAAVAALRWGFDERGADEIVAFTVVTNERSRRVMEKIGMVHDADGDFGHPRVESGSPQRRHVLYRATRSSWSPERPSQ